MLIECPSCRTRAKIPDSKEGAKVRCGECGRVYMAAPAGSRGRVRRSSSGSGAIIGVSVGAVALLGILFIYNKTKPAKAEPGTAEVVKKHDESAVDSMGWNSPLVQLGVRIHEAAFAYDEPRLMTLLHGPRLWAADQAERAAEGTTAPTANDYVLLPQGERQAFLSAVVADMVAGEAKALVADWRPFEGRVLDESDDEATVRLEVTAREEGSIEKRWVEWRLAKEGGRWRAWHWERWISPEERRAERKRRGRGYEQVTLADGSIVLEREPEPLGHLDDTPPELRERIDRLLATMIDLDLTKEASRAQHELEEIGRPAIPILLTGLFEIPLDTLEQAIQVNILVQALRTITGQYFGYKPQALQGSGTGTTEERRKSAVKQWFAWWYRNQEKFTEKELEDGLEGLIRLTDKEKRFLEREKQ